MLLWRFFVTFFVGFIFDFQITQCAPAEAGKVKEKVRPYEFGYSIEENQHRHEKRDENGIVMGEFGFITADGIYHVTVYATDENGKFKILAMKNYPYGKMEKKIMITMMSQSKKPAVMKVIPSSEKSCGGCILPKKSSQLPADVGGNKAKEQNLGFQPLSKTLSDDLPNVQNKASKGSPKPKGSSSLPTTPSSTNKLSGSKTNGIPKSPGQSSQTTSAKPQKSIDPKNLNGVQTKQSKAIPGSTANGKETKFSASDQISSGIGGSKKLFPKNPEKIDARFKSKVDFDQQKTDTPKFQNSPIPNGLGKKPFTQNTVNSHTATNVSKQGTRTSITSQIPNTIKTKTQNTKAPTLSQSRAKDFSSSTESFVQQTEQNSNHAFTNKTNTQRINKTTKAQISNTNNITPTGQQKQNANAARTPTPNIPSTNKQTPLVPSTQSVNKVTPSKNGGGPLYRFNYVLDYNSHREEGRVNGEKEGKYKTIDDDGIRRIIDYIANENGFQPHIKFERLPPNEKPTGENKLKEYEFVWFN